MMTNKHQIPQDLKDAIRAGIDEIRDLYNERAAINDKISAVRNGLKGKGVHKKALDHAMWYEALEDEARVGYDLSLHACREAAGVPLASQGELFEAMEAERKNVEKMKREEEKKLERDALFANTAEKRDQIREEENKAREDAANKADARRKEMRKKLDLDEQGEGAEALKQVDDISAKKSAPKPSLTAEEKAARNPIGFEVH